MRRLRATGQVVTEAAAAARRTSEVLRVHRDGRMMASMLINSGIVNWELSRLRVAARVLAETGCRFWQRELEGQPPANGGSTSS